MIRIKHVFGGLGAALAVVASVSAGATVLDAHFTGVVNAQMNGGTAVGNAIAGEFVYDTGLRRYLSFTIGNQAVAAGFASTASITPDLYSAFYQAQVSPLGGGSTNSTFTVDLEGINPWFTNDAVALLQNASALASNLDTTLSNFGFYDANADGTNIRSLNATLGAIRVAAVPEPGSVALVLIGLTAIGLRTRRRVAR